MPAIGRGRRPAADPVTALHHDDVVSEPDQFPRRGQAREAGPDDDDVGVGRFLFARALIAVGCVTRLGSHAVKVMTALFGPINAIEQARALREAGASGVFTFEGPNDVFAPLTLASTVGGLDLMTNVAIAFPRNPIHLAHQAIDHQTAQRGPVRARAGHSDPDADREAVRRAVRQAGGQDDRADRGAAGDFRVLGHRRAAQLPRRVLPPHADDADVQPRARIRTARRRSTSVRWALGSPAPPPSTPTACWSCRSATSGSCTR